MNEIILNIKFEWIKIIVIIEDVKIPILVHVHLYFEIQFIIHVSWELFKKKNLWWLTSPSFDADLPDQKRCEHVQTPRHWSGFLRSLEAARAHWVRRGSWFSSPKQLICSNVPMMREMAASWALLSLISSSYNENAYKASFTLLIFFNKISNWYFLKQRSWHLHSLEKMMQ